MKCAGAETLLPEIEFEAEEEGWTKVEWFKLRLRPRSVLSRLKDAVFSPLPAGKKIVQIFSDFFAYLMGCTETFIKDMYATMTVELWTTLRRDMIVVLAHPNGWEGAQQQQMRQSAILAKLVTDTSSGHDRVVFVTEGEASLHFCVRGTFIDDTRRGFIIADLGGGTLDFSAYKIRSQEPLRVEEIDVPKCILEGSVLVTQRASVFLKDKLKGSMFSDSEALQQMSHKFDQSTKLSFRRKQDTCYIAFGSSRDQDKEHGIRGGRMKLSGEEVAAFFEPSVSATVKAINEYIRDCPIKVSAVYLVGGFSSSPYLKSEIEV